ncbi:hypothetical protein PybrP1_012102 [[Pythium] brassicae (nom. inval.)]|nr:hypothetical protein PybrP1_012102 [[Pythium] brassicae (nom. inval.)]
MERAHGGGGDAKSVTRLRMPKPLPTHLQALEAAHQHQLRSAAAARHEARGRQDDDTDDDADDDANDLSADRAQWQLDEHERFMQALEAFGRERSGDEWLKIAAFVRTRSPEEVRHHGRCYLHQLVQLQQFAGPSSLEFAAGSDHDNQNDPNLQNHMLFAAADDVGAGGDRYGRQGKDKSAMKAATGGTGLRGFAQQQQQLQPSPNDAMLLQSSASRKSGRRAKVWTFEEDKIFENALAKWSSDKPYSWPKIATALPGKTAKDARNRYEKLVGDVAIIETSGGDDEPIGSRSYPYSPADHSLAYARGPHGSSLSDRIAPPPPIQSALSPTFFDFLACEEKPTAPTRDLTGAPSPSSSGSGVLLPSPEHSRRPAARSGGRAREPRRGGVAPTPRIWQEFLSDDFKFAAKPLPLSSTDELSAAAAASTETSESGSSTISQDMSSVSLLAPFASPAPSKPSRRTGGGGERQRECVVADSAPTLQMECDEPMSDTATHEEEEEELRSSERVLPYQHAQSQQRQPQASRRSGDTRKRLAADGQEEENEAAALDKISRGERQDRRRDDGRE